MIDRVANCRILDELGFGGMSVVYKAVQEPLGRIVAIKHLKPSIAIDSQFARRFEREASFMASMQHENVLHVHDFVRNDQGLFIIMEYVNGIDLAALLDKASPLPSDVAAILVLQVARALEYAHFRGIVHRDVKPANVMVSQHGDVKLMDFGIAGDESSIDPGEASASGVGTPSYMSPEQILGDKLDARSDVFSLGIVLYELVTGKRPFVEDDGRSVMQKIRLDQYVSPRTWNKAVPIELERILARAMQKLPANRYPSMQPLIDDLMEFLSPRVTANHRARLVTYLRDVGVVSGAKADEILSMGVGRAARSTRGRDRTLLGQVLLAELVVGLLVVATAVGVQRASGGFDPNTRAARTVAPIERKPEAYLAVVAEPWAEVHVDGAHLATTPFAHPLTLSPGAHFVRLVHPHLGQVDREIRIEAGKTERLVVNLDRPEGAR